VIGRKRKLTLNKDEIDAFQAISFMLDGEADNVEGRLPDAQASDLSLSSTDVEYPTIAEVLRAIAVWIRSIMNRI
jgi:hypothetical protein